MAQTNSANTANDPVTSELINIKRLLVLQLINSGIEAQHVAKALGISKSTLSRLVPARSVKKGKN